MHALPSLPRHPIAAGVLALLLALIALAATAPELGTLDFSVGAGGTSSAETFVAPSTGGAGASGTITGDPMVAPVELLSARYVAGG